jgi:hypothetical protein
MFNGPDGYQGSIDRLKGFTDVTASAPFNEVASSANANADDGYKNAIALLPKLKAEGVDYLWSFNQSIASGAIKALQQNGIIPGKDITIVDGSCSIGSETYASGESYGTVLQSAVIEARVAADSVARYLANEEVTPGDEQLENAPEEPETPTSAPAERVLIPMPPLEGAEAVATEKVWGLTVPVLCAQWPDRLHRRKGPGPARVPALCRAQAGGGAAAQPPTGSPWDWRSSSMRSEVSWMCWR